MEQTFLGSGTFSLLHLLGMLLMVGGAYKAITHKEDVRGLILWGALADVGLLLMGLGAANAVAVTGVTLFLVFQFVTRALALQSLYTLAPVGTELTLTALAAAGARMINGALYRPAFPCTDEQPLGMMLDPATGKRFVNEGAGRIPVFHAASKVLASNGRRMPLSLLDADAYELVENKHRMEKNAAAGYVPKHESLEDVAKHYNIPLEALKATIADYNAMVERGEDTAFKSDFSKTKANKVDKAPFYAVMVKPNLTYSLAGALITAQAQVVSVLTDAPIPGLYAAGEATSGVHGAMRLGGCAILDCCVFGMLAGRNVMKA